MFGQNPNSSFGNFNPVSQNSPFGQSAFGKPVATTSFGTSATPVFGSNTSLFNSKPAGTNGGGLFGNTSMTPAFGATTTSQSAFGGFGNTMSSGSTQPIFGQQANTNTSLFPPTSAFGQANKSTFGFGQNNTSLFGQTQQTNQQTAPFGQSTASTSGGLFGTAFGGAVTNNIMGTEIKFQPTTGTDTMIKSGSSQTIQTRHHCISCMKEYQEKSLEELRHEDYTLGRKGPRQGQATGGIFGTGTLNSPFAATSSTSSSTTGFGATTGGFGNTTSNLFTKPVAGFGAPATTSTSAFSFNNSTTGQNTGLFNTQNKPFGTANTSTSLFGTSNTAPTTGNVFGGMNTTQTFNTNMQNQNIGLFSQNKPVFNTPAATSAPTGFGGFGQTPAAQTSSLFGAKPAGTGFGTGFGTQATPFQATNTGFGSTQNNNTGSLFNTSFKPTTQNNSFMFGNTTGGATNTLGGSTGLTLGNPGAPLFQSTSKPSLFSNPGSSTTFQSTPFGGTGGFGLGSNTAPTLGGLYGNTGGLGGSSVQQSASSVPVHQQILALVSAPFGDSPLLKNLLPASGKTDQLLKPTNANVVKNQNSLSYKVASNKNVNRIKPKLISTATVSKKSIFEGLEDESPLIEAFQPRPNAKRLVLRPRSNNTTDLSVSRDDTAATDQLYLNTSIEEVLNKENKKLNLNTPRTEDDRRSSSSWLMSTIPRRDFRAVDDSTRDDDCNQSNPFYNSDTVNLEEPFETTNPEPRPGSSHHQDHQQQAANTSTEAHQSASGCSDKNVHQSELLDVSQLQDFNATDRQVFDDSVISLTGDPNVTHKCGIKLLRSGYYTIPHINDLDEFTCGTSCVVPNFTIGRQGYGNVYFPESFDVYGLNLDDIVHFRHKEIIIYPDDNVKPPVGQGLNRKAQVTLDRVWPLDKSTHEPITDPQRLAEMDYEGKLRRVSAKHGTKFLEYRPETGSWVFKVDHFSKYGLNDSDDEELEEEAGKKLPKDSVPTVVVNGTVDHSALALPEEFAKQISGVAPLSGHHLFGGHLEQSRFPMDANTTYSPTSLQTKLLGTNSHGLQLMKASFFDDDHMEEEDNDYEMLQSKQNYTMDVRKSLSSLEQKLYNQTMSFRGSQLDKTMELDNSILNMSSSILQKKSDTSKQKHLLSAQKRSTSIAKGLPPPTVQPKSVVLRYNTELAPYCNSPVNAIRNHCVADAGIHFGRSFRAGWGPNLTFISYGSHNNSCTTQGSETQYTYDQLHSYLGSGQTGSSDPTSMTVVQRLQVCAGKTEDNYFQGPLEAHLGLQLNACHIESDQNDCPVATNDGSVIASLLNDHRRLETTITDYSELNPSSRYFYNVWRLCECLWGDVPNMNGSNHRTMVARKEALGKWLQDIIAEPLDDNLEHDKAVFSLVSDHRLKEACQKSREVGNYTMALLISQFGGTSATRELISQQIKLWLSTGVSDNIAVEKLKLYMLFAGMATIDEPKIGVNVCENLDWKKAFALYFWYLCTPMSSLTDVLESYEAALEASCTAEPHPEYTKYNYQLQVSGDKAILDMYYNLIKLFCYGNYPLEGVLNPQTHTHDPLDYKLCWFLLQTLTSLGYSHVSDEVSTLIHINFATQLETGDLWHWSVFVLMHLKDAGRRRKAIMDLLIRHVEIDENYRDYLRREDFLTRKLQVPKKWIDRAKAIKSFGAGRYGKAAYHYALAENWNKAHEIIMRHLAADAIINENYDYIRALLELLPVNSGSVISEWANQGQLILDYMKITSEIKKLLNKETGTSNMGCDLELLSPELTSLCSKINMFPCGTVKHKLCQAEIAKTTFQLARNLFDLHYNDNQEATGILVNLISELPLPEDYAQQELRPIINNCVNEMVK